MTKNQILKITDGPNHAEIQEDWWEQQMDCRSSMAVQLEIADVGAKFIRSERHYCIVAEDALLSDGVNLRRPLVMSPATTSDKSQLWHFTGGIVFKGEMIPKSDCCVFCEYNAKSCKGAVMVTFDSRSIPEPLAHLKSDIKVFRDGEYDWICSYW